MQGCDPSPSQARNGWRPPGRLLLSPLDHLKTAEICPNNRDHLTSPLCAVCGNDLRQLTRSRNSLATGRSHIPGLLAIVDSHSRSFRTFAPLPGYRHPACMHIRSRPFALGASVESPAPKYDLRKWECGSGQLGERNSSPCVRSAGIGCAVLFHQIL